MKNLDFEWLTDEFMLYCRSTQLREKTMSSYEQTLHLFGRWLSDELKIYTVDKITERTLSQHATVSQVYSPLRINKTRLPNPDSLVFVVSLVDRYQQFRLLYLP